MFNSNFKENLENLVEIIDFEPPIVEKMIEFCETDTIKVTKGFESDLYQIASFTSYTRDLLKSTLTFENTCERLKVARMCSDEPLQKFLISFIRPNFQHFCKAKNIFNIFTDTEIVNILRDE